MDELVGLIERSEVAAKDARRKAIKDAFAEHEAEYHKMIERETKLWEDSPLSKVYDGPDDDNRPVNWDSDDQDGR